MSSISKWLVIIALGAVAAVIQGWLNRDMPEDNHVVGQGQEPSSVVQLQSISPTMVELNGRQFNWTQGAEFVSSLRTGNQKHLSFEISAAMRNDEKLDQLVGKFARLAGVRSWSSSIPGGDEFWEQIAWIELDK